MSKSIFTGAAQTRRAYWALVVLLLINMLNLIDRVLPSIVSELIKADLELSDAQLGMLGGIAFTAVYSLMAFPLARLADRGFRKWVAAAAVAFWSIMTALGGLATSFTQLLLTRVGVAMGEAGSVPASNSIITSLFPRQRLGFAIAVFGMAGGLATIFGRSFCSWAAEAFGWRTMFMIMSPIGLLLATVLILTVREPPIETKVAQSTIVDSARYMLRLPTLWQLTLANVGLNAALWSVQFFVAAFLIRVHGLTLVQAGVLMGLIGGCASMAGRLLGGYLFDRNREADPGVKLQLSTIVLIVCVPLYVATWLSPSLWVAMMLLVLTYLAHDIPLAPQIATLQLLSPANMRSTINAIYGVVGGLLGAGVGPPLTGWISDLFEPAFGTQSIRYALAIVSLSFGVTAYFVWLASKNLRTDLSTYEAMVTESSGNQTAPVPGAVAPV